MLLAILLIGVFGFVAAWAVLSFAHDTKSLYGWSVRTFGRTATVVAVVILAVAFAAVVIRLFS